MADEPVKVEKLGIEHVPEDLRHGSANRTFTLWFAANLTIADYVIGIISTGFTGFTMSQVIPILLVGNLLGGLFVGLAAAMGPSLGFPQMLSSRASFGRLGNYIPGALNWISTVGWFTVNTILAVVALRVIFPGANFVLSAAAYVVIQAVIAIYGHDFIHLFEKVMSIVLGLLFLLIFVLTIPDLGKAFAYQQGGSGSALSLGSVGAILIICFSYLMSWAPYASDYSRYFAPSTSKTKVLALALAGGAVSSFAIEVLGALVGSLTPSETGSFTFFNGLNSYAGSFGALAMIALILGAFAADALNLYTNSLSALVLDVKAKRWMTVAAGGITGFIIAVAVQANFESFFENFLLALSYWIMPWLAIILIDFYIVKRTSVETSTNPVKWDWPVLAIYGFSILVSVPFMVPQLTLGYPVGALSSWFGGADFSYFISFAVALLLTALLRMKRVRTEQQGQIETRQRTG